MLLRPPFSASNAILWLTPVLALLAGGGLMIVLLRRRAAPAGEDPLDSLSPEEEARLQVLLKDQ
ncbi:cytochrome c-type biogenesis protein CcmH [Caulobacter sp. B11]|uniref:cytochrome c-type biogenesis protein n=1 Tax=Caulobacter sp. B11 TaxID=2048899 RepID=UPI0021012B5A|nr:cytochrome c-type biogenesis protein CcmH [Caulobacter sp. B11]